MSRSKAERIIIKMGFPQSGTEGRQKDVMRRDKWVREREYSETILLVSRARAGLLNNISFFY
jgi:hypothetical protein